jgi:hypothetical protein
MDKITILKTVYWLAAGKQMYGKVRQIMSDHAVVRTADGDHIVRKALLSTRPHQTNVKPA